MTFNNNDDLFNFVKKLKQELISIGENKISNELIDWENSYFTTSSEFLGELRIILRQIESCNPEKLNSKTKTEIKDCIKSINEAFARSNGNAI